jgi:hypothetical protein
MAFSNTRLFAPPLAASTAPSKRAPNILTGTFEDPGLVGLWSLAWGKASSSPATFGALTNPQVTNEVQFDRMQLVDGATETVTFSVSLQDMTGFTVGDHLWLCYFQGVEAPSSGDVPTFVQDLGVLIA